MQKISEMFRDRPIDPLENAVYWTNYVLKYDTSLLKPLGINQTWYERRLLDVYGFLLLILGTTLYLVIFVIRMLYKAVMKTRVTHCDKVKTG